MKEITKDTILDVAKALAENYEKQDIIDTSFRASLPDRQVVYSILDDLHKISFPGYFGTERFLSGESFAEGMLVSVYEKMKAQLKRILGDKEKAKELTQNAIDALSAFEDTKFLVELSKYLLKRQRMD